MIAVHAEPAHGRFRAPGFSGTKIALTALCSVLAQPVAVVAAPVAVNPAYEEIEWLIGEWQAEFRPHGDDLPTPTMSFSWGDDQRSYLAMTGTQPTPGGELEPEYESMVVWHPVKQRFVFLGVYRSSGGRVIEDGELEIHDDGSVALKMNVRYPAGAPLPFSGGAKAGTEGHTLEFRRTLQQVGEDQLRGVFRIRRGDGWESPHAGAGTEDGFLWRRLDTRPEPSPAWVLEHWERLVGNWIADNSAYRSDAETIEELGLEWSWGLGRKSIVGRLYGLEGGEETRTFWEFREFWDPGAGRLTTEQFGADGTYGVGTQMRQANGSLELVQTFYYPSAGTTARTGHRSTWKGDAHATESFEIDTAGEWIPRRSYVWRLVER